MESQIFSDKHRGVFIEAKLISPVQSFYYPRDIIKIEVKVSSEKKTRINKIKANLVFRTVCTFFDAYIPDGRLESVDSIAATQVVLDKEIPAKFSNIYEISLPIPDNALPSYHGDSMGIGWFVEVTHTLSWDLGEFNLTNPIVLVAPLPNQQNKPIEKINKGKKVEIILNLPKLNWVEGERIQGQVKVRPFASDLGPLLAELIFIEEIDKAGLKSTNGGRLVIASELLTDNVALPLGKFSEYSFELDIPQKHRPSIQQGGMSANWYVAATTGKGLFPTSCLEQIFVYTTGFREKPTTQPESEKIGVAISSESVVKPVQEPSLMQENLTGEQKMALLRLRELHNNVGKAKRKGNAWGQPLLFGGIAGVIACFFISIPLVYIVRAINGSTEPSAIPGCVGLIFLMLTSILTTVFLRRNAQRHSGDLVAKEEANLKSEIDKTAASQPDWVNKIGGTISLLDSRMVDSLLKTK